MAEEAVAETAEAAPVDTPEAPLMFASRSPSSDDQDGVADERSGVREPAPMQKSGEDAQSRKSVVVQFHNQLNSLVELWFLPDAPDQPRRVHTVFVDGSAYLKCVRNPRAPPLQPRASHLCPHLSPAPFLVCVQPVAR